MRVRLPGSHTEGPPSDGGARPAVPPLCHPSPFSVDRALPATRGRPAFPTLGSRSAPRRGRDGATSGPSPWAPRCPSRLPPFPQAGRALCWDGRALVRGSVPWTAVAPGRLLVLSAVPSCRPRDPGTCLAAPEAPGASGQVRGTRGGLCRSRCTLWRARCPGRAQGCTAPPGNSRF